MNTGNNINDSVTFSVVIPAYNAASFILTTLLSVYRQTYTDFEVIVVNDGSTDSTLQILDGQKDERLRVICQDNAGVSVARNRAIKEARGKYIAFLDADDVWTCDHLALAHAFFERYPEFVWYSSGYESVQEITDDLFYRTPSRERTHYQARNWALELARKAACANMVVLRSIIDDANLFPSGVKMCEDAIGFAKIAIKYPMIGYLDSTTLWYRKHSESACALFIKSPHREEMETCYLMKLQELAMSSQCSRELRLFVDLMSYYSWWRRIRSMSMKPWMNEIKSRRYITGSFLTFWLICAAYMSELFCRIIGKMVRLRYNYTVREIERGIQSTRRDLGFAV